MMHYGMRERRRVWMFNGTVLGMTALAVLALVTLPGNSARAADTQSHRIEALPESAMYAVISLDGVQLGVCDSMALAQRVVDLAVRELRVDGGEATVLGTLEIKPELCPVDACMSAGELFRELTQGGALRVESLVTCEVTELIPYETRIVEDPCAYAAKSCVLQQGADGQRVCVRQDRYVNGEYVSSLTLSERTVTDAVSRIEYVGLLGDPVWWPTGTFIQPVQGMVTSEFGQRGSEMHTGIDIGNVLGTSIVAADGGTVLYADWLGGYGNYVVLDHEGIYTCYAHCSQLLVSPGEHVVQGQEIA